MSTMVATVGSSADLDPLHFREVQELEDLFDLGMAKEHGVSTRVLVFLSDWPPVPVQRELIRIYRESGIELAFHRADVEGGNRAELRWEQGNDSAA